MSYVDEIWLSHKNRWYWEQMGHYNAFKYFFNKTKQDKENVKTSTSKVAYIIQKFRIFLNEREK